MSRLLLDSCILIDCLRRHRAAIDYLARWPQKPLLSTVTVAEIDVGVRDAAEARRVEALFRRCEILSVSGQIARRGGRLRRRFARNHGTGLLDALIAATAETHGARLVTSNVRHFPMFDDLVAPYD